MKSPDRFQRLLRARLVSFCTALALHFGWALTLAVILMGLRRWLAGGTVAGPAALFVTPLVAFAVLCAVGSAAIWGCRQQVVRRIRDLNDDDIAAMLAAGVTGAVSMTLVSLVAAAIPGLARLFSRGELDALMVGALVMIGVLAVSLGWVLFEGLGGLTSPLPGRLEQSLSRQE